MAKKKFPTRQYATFVLSEDLRAEVNGKITLLGVYPAAGIRIFSKPTKANPAKLRLVFSFFFRDGYGTFKPKVVLRDPKGNTLLSKDFDQVEKEAKSSLPIALIALIQSVTTVGEYHVTAYLDDQEYTFPIDILSSVPPDGDKAESAKPTKKVRDKKKTTKSRRTGTAKKKSVRKKAQRKPK